MFIELVQLVNRFLRQQLQETIDQSVARPIRNAGRSAALAILAAGITVLAIIFLAVGLFQLLASMVGAAWIAYLIVGGTLALVAAVLMLVRGRARNGG